MPFTLPEPIKLNLEGLWTFYVLLKEVYVGIVTLQNYVI